MNQYLVAKKEEFRKAVEFFKKDISALRTGRANTAILEGVQVEAYGAKTPLVGLSNVTAADARSLIVSPWDKNIVKDVEKAILEAGLGLGVVNEGDKIRLTIPAMTEENRKDLVKKLNEKTEQAKVSVRQNREAIKTAIEKAEKDKAISEDDRFRFMEELEEEVKRVNEELKTIRDKKEKEVMTI
ncbi:MAG TPA: ribosome recycling factor [Candidatus Nanoarchaeia archaeon]|nr:ribosome recycling factor [Candidatus Nanoarchaeia archaeon]